MEEWLHFVRGPLFIMTFLYMILALKRLFVIQLFAIPTVLKDAGDRKIDTKDVSRRVLEWFVPVKRLFAAKPGYSVISFIWHISLIVLPLFLIDHLLIWVRSIDSIIGGLGISFGFLLAAGIPKHAADALASLVIVLTILMFFMRAVKKDTRTISEPLDYVILLALLVPFITGFMAAHPEMNPVGYTTTMLVHVLGAELVFVLIPSTKLSHTILFPFAKLVTRLFWKLPEGTGEQIKRELYGEEAKV